MKMVQFGVKNVREGQIDGWTNWYNL